MFYFILFMYYLKNHPVVGEDNIFFYVKKINKYKYKIFVKGKTESTDVFEKY